MIFANSDNEITIVYNSNSQLAKEVLAYAKSENLPIREIDTAHTHVSGTQWAELADRLDIKLKDLVNPEHPDYSQYFEEYDFEDANWLKFLEKNPQAVKGPIAFRGDHIRIMTNPQDMVHFNDKTS